MHVQSVTDIQIPELQPYRTLRRSREHYDQGLFIAEGEKVVSRLLTSNLRVRSVLLSHDWFRVKKEAIAALDPAPVVFTGSKEKLEEVVGYNLHQGIMALGEVPQTPPITEILQTTPRPRLLLAIDDLLNAENVGVIIRNAKAFGVDCVLVGESSSSPYLRRAVRNSMGSVFSIPVVHVSDLATQVAELSARYAVRTIGAESRMGGRPIDTIDLSDDVCLVVGGENAGIRENVLKACEHVVEIPMVQGMDSINVANAAAVCLYEIRRQRQR